MKHDFRQVARAEPKGAAAGGKYLGTACLLKLMLKAG